MEEIHEHDGSTIMLLPMFQKLKQCFKKELAKKGTLGLKFLYETNR